jgi:hypothetical protein
MRETFAGWLINCAIFFPFKVPPLYMVEHGIEEMWCLTIAGSAVGGEGEAGSAAAGETPVSVSAGVSTTVDVLCTFVYIWGGSKSGYRHFSTPAVKQHRSGVVPIYQRISETSSKALYLHTQLLGTPGNSDHSPRQLRPSLLSL